ncbi:MAG: tRNA (adenosine(37)-N6)-threonylcarbamoyltransferase complex dimerization subunit type 1 TsaB [Chloroflexi bacterium]|nr:tRNA (adenosine(37)-N6)-threonylcarbamoyltransferase complex dimerization subunit type 1 TsaB [Chloroflexota bacterium]
MILAIDTATRFVSIALHDGHRLLAEHTWLTQAHHTVELTPALADMLATQTIEAQALDAIAVPTGPGSYTGLRIGMSVAKGIARSRTPAIPLIGVPTMSILAAAQPRLSSRLCVVTEAGRRRVNAQFYHWKLGGWQAEGEPFLATWPELAEKLGSGIQVSGEITDEGRDILAALGSAITLSLPAYGLRRAGFLAELAYQRLRHGETDDPATLAPLYLR